MIGKLKKNLEQKILNTRYSSQSGYQLAEKLDALNKQTFPPLQIAIQNTGGTLSNGCFYQTTFDHDNTWSYFDVGPYFIDTNVTTAGVPGVLSTEYIEVNILNSAQFLFNKSDCVLRSGC